jgi:hypothetical protein
MYQRGADPQRMIRMHDLQEEIAEYYMWVQGEQRPLWGMWWEKEGNERRHGDSPEELT